MTSPLRCTRVPVPRHLSSAPCCREPEATRPACLSHAHKAQVHAAPQNRTVPAGCIRQAQISVSHSFLWPQTQTRTIHRLALGADVSESQGCSGCPCKQGARQDQPAVRLHLAAEGMGARGLVLPRATAIKMCFSGDSDSCFPWG